MQRSSRLHRGSGPALVALVATAALFGCGGSDLVLPDDGAPASIEVVEGNNQNGTAGAALGGPLVARVLDNRRTPVARQSVEFALDSDAPGAEITPTSAETGDDGVARAQWVLGATSGTQAVVAQVVGDGVRDDLRVRFNASVSPAAAAAIAALSGDGQTGPVATALPEPLVVRVTDRFGNPVAGVPVQWDAKEGVVDPNSAATGDDGRAAASWILGSATGSQAATVSSPNIDGAEVTFTGQARAGSANSLVRVSGNDQSARVGSELPNALVVQLLDSKGNGVPDRPVTWLVASGGGSVSPATSNTDDKGEAKARWTLGSSPGSNRLNAVASGTGVIPFSATATGSNGGGGGGGGGGGDISSEPSRLVFGTQPADTRRNKKISPAVMVEVLDADGRRFTDRPIEIKLELRGGDGKLSGDRAESTRSGIATFSDLKVDKEGDYRLHATADGLPSVDSDRFTVAQGNGGGGHGD